jgi:hypothetical protein
MFKEKAGACRVAQEIEHLFKKCEALSSNPSNTKKRKEIKQLNAVEYTCSVYIT